MPSFKKSLLVLALFSLFVFSACGPEKEVVVKDATTEKTNTLRMLYSEWPPDMIAYLAQEKGFFQKHGVDVELVWVDGFDDAHEKRANNETDIWNYTLLDFLTEYADGTEKSAQIFLIQDFSAGADAIVTMPENEINSVGDLKGKKVAVESGTIGEFFLKILLNKDRLTLEDLDIVQAAAEEVPALLKSGEIDAGVTYEPYVTESVAEGGKILVDSSQERGTIVDVYVAKSEHIAQNKDAYLALSKALLEASDYYNQNPEEAAEIMKEPLGLSKEEALATFKTFQIPDLRDNKTAFDRVSGFASLYNLGKLAKQYLEEQGILAEDFDLAPLINSSLVDSI